ncbi:SsrA-binding protein [Helicobacter pylori]|uniref:SsrA-binding protein n=1 Tax=Helicobacter pylori TaxID=210 RepID=UPI001FD32D0D|nr:SsrA-binding protein [Helicobacter pylori]UOS13478.1 SsrA-binding protein [Helicobacter pylori]
MIGLPDVGGRVSCSVSLMDFTEFDLQRILSTAFTHHIYKGVTLHASPTLDANVWGCYNKLAVFIPIAKDV